MARLLLDHVSDRVFAAEMHVEPYPHFVVDDVYPRDFADRFLAAVPGREEFSTYFPDTPRENENTFIMRPEAFAACSSKHHAILEAVRETFPLISRLIATKFSPFFPEVFRQIFPRDHASRIGEVAVHHSLSLTFLDRVSSYVQHPHTDASYRIATWLYYLPVDTGGDLPGTEIYEVTGLSPQYDPLQTYFAARPLNAEVRQVKELAYRSNRIVALLNSPTSFHGYQHSRDTAATVHRRITMNNWIEYERDSYIRIFADTPPSYFDLHYDQIWRPAANGKAGDAG